MYNENFLYNMQQISYENLAQYNLILFLKPVDFIEKTDIIKI